MANYISKNIPNTITCCNLLSGCVAIVYAFGGNLKMAFIFIIIGAIFDFFDGMSARLLNVSSSIGKELDSLADIITFGVAPSTMVFMELHVMDYPLWMESARGILPFIAYLMVAFSALRLAKFNLDERQAMGFIGLPTPANALFWASLIVGGRNFIEEFTWTLLAIVVLVIIMSLLMVAEIPMFALKFKNFGWKQNKIRYIFLISSAVLILIFGLVAFAIIILWYVILSHIVNLKN